MRRLGSRRKHIVAAALGATAAVGADVVTTRVQPKRRTEASAAGLVTAAAIYSLARRRSFGNGREKITLVAALALVGAALGQPEKARLIVAGGWLAHAGFDAAFTSRDDSRIPSWYPAMCAGYDVAAAARLATT
jgi:hypothetical protein